jgi:hypothetical protein
VRFAAVPPLPAFDIGGLAAYVVQHAATGPWRRQWGYLVGLLLLAGAVLANCSGDR